MLSDVFLLALDGTKLVSLDVASLLDGLGHVSVSFDPLDLGHVGVASDQGLVVLYLLLLPGRLDAGSV